MVLAYFLFSLAAARLYTNNRGSSFSNRPLTQSDEWATDCSTDFAGVSGCSGQVQVTTNGSRMFYWMLYKNGTSSIEATDKTPVILWLQGGPGCSSMTGLFEELGPLRLNQTTMELYKTPISWQNDYHLLFIDNPIGAGYSYAASKDDYVTNYTQMADNLYYMLSQLATMYPTWFTGRQFFIFGESYAGHWVPAIAYKILEQNNNSTATHFPLAGIGIGDGWTDPYNQLSKNNEFGLSAGLTDINTANLVQNYQSVGRYLISQGQYCNAQPSFDNIIGTIQAAGGGVNEYNIRVIGEYNFGKLNSFLNSTDFKSQLHVTSNTDYVDCDGYAYQVLCSDFMNSVTVLFPTILSQIRVLLYNGQNDLIVNTPSAEYWISQLQWYGQSGYNNATRTVWTVNGETAGFMRQYDNLYQVLINNAGHFAPMDQPANVLDMVNNFVHNTF